MELLNLLLCEIDVGKFYKRMQKVQLSFNILTFNSSLEIPLYHHISIKIIPLFDFDYLFVEELHLITYHIDLINCFPSSTECLNSTFYGTLLRYFDKTQYRLHLNLSNTTHNFSCPARLIYGHSVLVEIGWLKLILFHQPTPLLVLQND